MLHQKADKRPGVDILLQHQQIQVRIQEKKFKEKYASLKKKETDYAHKEKQVEIKLAEQDCEMAQMSGEEKDLLKLIKELEIESSKQKNQI